LVKQVGFPRGDTSHPLNPGVELSGTKVQHFLHISKGMAKKIAIFSVEGGDTRMVFRAIKSLPPSHPWREGRGK
jgi:hypothetical protein